MSTYKERGVMFPGDIVPRSNLELLKTFDIRDDDIMLITYPKTGTWWLHQVIKQILAEQGVKDEKYLGNIPNLIEFTLPVIGPLAEVVKTAPSPRVLATHVPVEFLPDGLLGSKAKDLPAEVKKLCSFLEKPLSDEEVQTVVAATQFDSMKNTLGEKGQVFTRKGVIGDWKNYFSDDQSRAYDEQYRERLANTGLEFQFQ
ncbi:sulfotransferase family cytosolic 1B member 1-like [Branchiostoma floridae]|uniref:Sulfotransferase n=1 Tax=Branchiostoma floridae TaxID=7739 RepID=A0A9J7LCM1_BRAFL|nr:sulfotransferase family cytosolic 1B member 1-like [Branchiostoma floridae]